MLFRSPAHCERTADGAYQRGHAEELLSDVGQLDLCGPDFPVSAVGYALAAKGARDDLVSEANPWTVLAGIESALGGRERAPKRRILGLSWARNCTNWTKRLIHSTSSYADAAVSPEDLSIEAR